MSFDEIKLFTNHHKLVHSPFIDTVPFSNYRKKIHFDKEHYLLIIFFKTTDKVTNSRA